MTSLSRLFSSCLFNKFKCNFLIVVNDRVSYVKINCDLPKAPLTLYIIIEGAVLLPVLSKEAEGVVVSKVLKLNQSVLPIFVHHSLHKLINQIIIGL